MADPRLSPSGQYIPPPSVTGPPGAVGFFDALGNLTGTPRIGIDGAGSEQTFKDNADSPTAQIRRSDGRAWFQELRITSDTGPRILAGIGDPDGLVVGDVGEVWLRLDGGFNTTLYIKEFDPGLVSGWVAIAVLTPPTNPAENTFAAKGRNGDLEYDGRLRFPALLDRVKLYAPFLFWDTTAGSVFMGFDPLTAPLGAPQFGIPNEWGMRGQNAGAGSGSVGGRVTFQCGLGDGPGLMGRIDFLDPFGAILFSVGTGVGGVGYFGAGPIPQQTILGSRMANPALADLLTKLALGGLIVDGTVL